VWGRSLQKGGPGLKEGAIELGRVIGHGDALASGVKEVEENLMNVDPKKKWGKGRWEHLKRNPPSLAM